MSEPYVLGIEQGSSRSQAMVLDRAGRIVGYGSEPVALLFPQPGLVEQDPRAIATSVRVAAETALARAGCPVSAVVGCGIASQEDALLAWEQDTGRPIGNAIAAQDQRTLPLVGEVDQWPLADEWRSQLQPLPIHSSPAMQIVWRMRHDPAFRQAADGGYLRLSLAAGWIVQALGRLADHALDYSLMQAMGMFDLRGTTVGGEWVDALNIPRAALPQAVPTLHHFGEIRLKDRDGRRGAIPVLATITNQHGSLFGYDCHTCGQSLCIHGDSSVVYVIAGPAIPAQSSIRTRLAWQLDGVATYLLQADTTATGAAVHWMQEPMGFIKRPADLGPLALSVADSAGVLFVPAFTGVGALYEQHTARGTILGMTLNTTPAHIARAFLESLGYQLHDILDTISRETGIIVEQLQVGGGISASDAACQIQADALGIPVIRSSITAAGARGAALLAGLHAGIWTTVDTLPALPGDRVVFEPRWSDHLRGERIARWHEALKLVRQWTTGLDE